MCAFVPADAVAHGIEMGAHARLAHPAKDERVGFPLLRREEDAREAAFELGQAAQRIAMIEHAPRVEGCEEGGMRIGHGTRGQAAILPRGASSDDSALGQKSAMLKSEP